MVGFVHALTIYRTPYDDAVASRDDYGQPDEGLVTTTAVKGLVQPRPGRGRGDSEQDDYRSAGAQVSDHVIFLPIGTDLEGADSILKGDDRYNVVGIRRFEYGGLAHLEVDAVLVTPATDAEGVGS